MKTPRIVIFCLLLAGVVFAQPIGLVRAEAPTEAGIILSESSSELIRFKVNFAWDTLVLTETQTDEGTFTSVAFADAATTDETGAPQLPVIGQLLAVPFGVEFELEIIPGKAHIRKINAPVLPVPKQAAEWSLPTELYGAVELLNIRLEYDPNPEYYESNSSYPASLGKIATDSVIRQQRVVGIALHPVQYDPVNEELTIYESFEVMLAFEGHAQITRSASEPESQAYEAFFSQNLLNYETSPAWRLDVNSQNALQYRATPQAGTAAVAWSPPDPGWRVTVREEGFYLLSYAELSTAGVDMDKLDPQTLQMFHLGEEIAIQVNGEADGSFDPADSLVFYGQALDDKYTLDNVYWLTYGEANGLRMAERQVSTPTAQLAQTVTDQLHLEENNWYITGVPGNDNLDRFLWAGIYAGIGAMGEKFNYYFSLTSPIAESGQLDLDLLGQTTHTQGNKAIVELNGHQLGVLEWAGETWAHFSAPIPAGTLVAGSNTLSIWLDNTSGTLHDFVYLDRGDLFFGTGFQAVSNQLTFTYNLTQDNGFEIQGFSTDQLALFDLTNPNVPVQLIGFGTQAVGDGYSLAFQEIEKIIGEHSYAAVAPSMHKTAYAVEKAVSADLLSPSNAADYLIITHADFLAPAQTLGDYRAGQGLRVKVVDVRDIYDQFGFGIEGRDPIQAFLAHTYAHWVSPAPSYVVLLGDGNYNPKGYNQAGYLAESFIPPYLAFADPFLGETAADNRYAAILGDDSLPDMMLGRMAVSTEAQATAFVNKIMAYEQLPANNNWGTPLLAIADKPDKAGNFPALSQVLLESSYPADFSVERVYLGVTQTTMVAAKEAVITAINDGRFLVNYIGHGATFQWADGVGFLAVDDIEGLTNQDKYPIISAMTCDEGYYIHPYPVGNAKEALAEVITRAENKGAVASWSPTGKSVANGHEIINRGFFKAIFSRVVPTIGQATQQSLNGLWATGTHLDLADTFLLFGDPAMNIQRVLTAMSDVYETEFGRLLEVSVQNGVLINDINPKELQITAELVSGTSFGQLTFNEDGSFTYLPNSMFFGVDSFSYRISAGTEFSNTAKVTIIVQEGWHLFLPVILK